MSATQPSTLAEVLAGHAARQPDRTWLIAPEPGHELGYAGLAAQAGAFARWTAAQGLPPGTRIALLLPNGVQASLLFLATMNAGHVTVPLNLLSTPAQLVHCLRHSGAALVFTTRELEPRIAQVLPELAASGGAPAVHVVDADSPELPDAPGAQPAGAPAPQNPALLMYTSGTTGTPKGVPLTHANLLHAARSVGGWHELGPDDRVLSALPLYHINGQVIATVTPFVSGGSIVAPHKFSASQWWPMAERYRCTWLNMVPTIIAYLLNSPDGPSAPMPWLRFGRSASAPLPPEHHRAFEERFGVPIVEAMGMTETASVAFCNPHHPEGRRYGSPGLPCGVEARVVDERGRPVPDGTVGEIMLRGANIMHAYYDNPEESAKSFDAEGWLHTGDLGFRDAEGYFKITGRIKELIIKGGENIAPREIDESLLSHPAVLEAAAVGLPDANYGQEIYAAVILKPDSDVSPEALRAHCQETLGKYKTPREIRVVDDLPKGPSGKVQRLKLVDFWHAAEPGRSKSPA